MAQAVPASAPRFCVAQIGLAEGAEVALPDAAAHHAARVLRLAVGDAVTLFDGRGGEYAALLLQVDKRGVRARIDHFDPVERETPHAPILAMSVIATDTMDIALRKAVELGVASIEPVAAARSQGSAGGERAIRRVAHWRQIAQAACEQCGRNRIPPVADIVGLDAWLANVADGAVMLLPAAPRSLAALASERAPRALLVGPEGGFTAGEQQLGECRGVAIAHIGPRVLRAETAAIAALAIVAAVGGDLR
ncbi:MAG: 16S rRNA (uracil(1498)-N(3))-methyltransferase [Casimicrobiaceae bacterium]